MKPRLFIIDTNVLVAGLISTAKTAPTVEILDAMLKGSILYVVSPALLQEYRTVLLRPKLCALHGLPESDVDQILAEITANSIWQEPALSHQAPDPGDNHLWSLLLHGVNTILVTGDLLLLDNAPKDKLVITPRTCLEMLKPVGVAQ